MIWRFRRWGASSSAARGAFCSFGQGPFARLPWQARDLEPDPSRALCSAVCGLGWLGGCHQERVRTWGPRDTGSCPLGSVSPVPGWSQAPSSTLQGQPQPCFIGEQTGAQRGLKTCPGAHCRVGAELASCCHRPIGPHRQGEGLGQSQRVAGVGVSGISPRVCSWTQVHSRHSLCAHSAPPGSPHRPKYKGKYCVGERKRFRLCNLQACPPGRPSFRHVQCSRFDAMLYKGQLHTWVPVVNYGESCHPRDVEAPGAGSGGLRLPPPAPPNSPACSLAESQGPGASRWPPSSWDRPASRPACPHGSCTWAPSEPLRAALPPRQRVLC